MAIRGKLGKAESNLQILLKLKDHYGTLNCALVHEYIRVHGHVSQRQMSQDIGLHRDVIVNCIQEWPESGHPK